MRNGVVFQWRSVPLTTVKKIPVKITQQPADTSAVYGYTTSPQLTVRVDKVEGTSEISYQWYTASDNKAVDGETNNVFTLPKGLDVGSYQYYCMVTRDNYNLQSETVDVTIVKEKIEDVETGDAKTGDIKTGDHNNLVLWVVLLGISFSGLIVLKRNKKHSK